MVERRYALAGLATVAAVNTRVSLTEVYPGSILQIAAWPETLATVKDVLTEILGIRVPHTGSGLSESDVTIATVAPGRYLVSGITSDVVARLEGALRATDGSITDFSHGHTILRLDGEASEALLARCVALDLHASSFPIGRVARTAVHHIDVVVHRLHTASFDLWVSRSFGESLAEWILDAGIEFPIEFRRAAPIDASQMDTPAA